MANKKNYKEDYDLIVFEYNLGALSKEEQSRAIIYAASDVQGEICKCSDRIKIDNLNTVNDLMGVKMTKGEWGRIVKTCMDIDKNGSNPKFIEKLGEETKKQKLLASIQTMLQEKAVAGARTGLEMPTDIQNEDIISDINDNFTELIEDSVATRGEMVNFLNKKYKTLSQAFQHLWDYELTGADFHKIVDDLHYTEGGYPKETTPPRTWSALKTFQLLFKTMQMVGLGEYIDEYLAMLGLKCEVIDDGKLIREWDGKHPDRPDERAEKQNKPVAKEKVENATNNDPKSSTDTYQGISSWKDDKERSIPDEDDKERSIPDEDDKEIDTERIKAEIHKMNEEKFEEFSSWIPFVDD